MKYMMLNFRNEAASANMTEEERMQEIQDYNAFFEYASQRATIISGEAVHPTSAATTIRVRNGKTLTTDGPFAETHEGLAGFYVIDCKDLDEAIEIASKIPVAREGCVEIRPVIVFE
ncbi:MAG: YciI family protein [Anaerolineales bacterium]